MFSRPQWRCELRGNRIMDGGGDAGGEGHDPFKQGEKKKKKNHIYRNAKPCLEKKMRSAGTVAVRGNSSGGGLDVRYIPVQSQSFGWGLVEAFGSPRGSTWPRSRLPAGCGDLDGGGKKKKKKKKIDHAIPRRYSYDVIEIFSPRRTGAGMGTTRRRPTARMGWMRTLLGPPNLRLVDASDSCFQQT
jgi:hypothetical protein